MQTPVTIEDEPEPSIICVSSSQPEESTDQVDQSLTELSSLVDGYGEAVFACSSTADSQDSSQSPSTTNPGRSIIQAKKQIIDYFRAAQTGATEMIAKLQGEVDKANTSAREKGTEVEKLLRESGRLKAKLANEQNYTLAYRDARDKALKEVKEAKEKYEVLSEKQARSRKRAREVFETSKRVKLE
jgi:valyl-tRNA synthetase